MQIFTLYVSFLHTFLKKASGAWRHVDCVPHLINILHEVIQGGSNIIDFKHCVSRSSRRWIFSLKTFILVLDDTSWAQCYKHFLARNLQIFVIS